MATAYRLNRTGNAPLKLTGTLMCEQDGEWGVARKEGEKPRQYNRYHTLRLYQLDKGGYCVQIVYETLWQGEVGFSRVALAQTPEEVIAELRAYDPTSKVRGFPPKPGNEQRQANLLADVKLRYEAQIATLLSKAPPEFSEEA